MLLRLLQNFSDDCQQMSVSAACIRAVRTASLLTVPRDRTALSNNSVLRSHVRAIRSSDPYFYVSHRHYLAQGFTVQQRVDAARCHYEHEASTFNEQYHRFVYSTPGLTLWKQRVANVDYEIRLGPGADVLYEGGLSVVLYVDGRRVSVLSYSYIDRRTVFERVAAAQTDDSPTLFVTRKQLTSKHDYQRAFFAAFDRCTAAHCCMAALMAIASAQGLTEIATIRPEAHPRYGGERRAHFHNSYGDFWRSLRGQPEGRFAFRVPVPMTLTPLGQLRSKARRRATRRRRHLRAIHDSALTVIRQYLQSAQQSQPRHDAPM